jgi:transposase InsO family protein
MGHIMPSAAKRMVDTQTVKGIMLDGNAPISFCDACVKGRMAQVPIPKERQSPQSKIQGEKVHTDVWGLSEVQNIGGKQWYISFTDDYTCETITYLMKHKSEALNMYKAYEALMHRQHGTKIKKLQSDSGSEYTSNEFKTHLAKVGTIQQLTVHDTL